MTVGLIVLVLSTHLSQAFALSLSPEIGKIQQTLNGSNGKTLILIQEAHVDYEGQKAMIKILEAVIAQKSVRQILVEGGWDDVSLSYLRAYGDPEGRRKIAETYLKSGKISAEEYLDIVGEHDIQLWGIEDKQLYEENMKAFLKIHETQTKQLENLSEIEAQLDGQVKKIFSPELLRFEENRKAFLDQKISMPVYLRDLTVPGTVPGTTTAYPHLSQILELTGNSKVFDMDKVEPEKQELLRTLSRHVSKLELEPVTALMKKRNPEAELEYLNALFEMLLGNPPPQFVGRIRPLADKRQTPNSKFKNLKAYQTALAKMQSMDFCLFFSELNQLEAVVAQTLTKTPEQKALLESIRYVENLRKLFELKMTPEEFQALKLLTVPGIVSQDIQPFIPIAASFYESAIRREKALTEKITARMESMPDTTGVVITGGFHSEHLIQELHKQGYTVVNVTPRFQPEEPGKLQEKYFRILKEKWTGDGDRNNQVSKIQETNNDQVSKKQETKKDKVSKTQDTRSKQ
ncbi:MAG: hypothetical protein EXS63_06385 [Candidatus Omnitrophica bacterium]|nr:hypothetical protein [Candidatus Omnitrophota bacterium]